MEGRFTAPIVSRRRWPYGSEGCQAHGFQGFAVALASICGSAAIAWGRYHHYCTRTSLVPLTAGDTERRRIKQRAGWSVLNSVQCFPNRRVWMGRRVHAHNMLHSLQKRREREGGKACFEMFIRKTVSALATVLASRL